MHDNKPRLPRIDRTEEYHVEDDSTHLWAISYADFLMVLLSFFILFFSVDNEEKENVIEKILTATAESTGEGQGEGKGPGIGGTATGRRTVAAIPTEALEQLLSKWKVKVDKDEKRIIFMFEEDIYPLGKVDLDNSVKTQLSTLLNKLMPFAEDIDLTFVGHTDVKQFGNDPHRNKFLSDNFELSVLRATRALQYSMRQGFPSSRMSAKGSADKKRNTRSLSVVIRARTDDI